MQFLVSSLIYFKNKGKERKILNYSDSFCGEESLYIVVLLSMFTFFLKTRHSLNMLHWMFFIAIHVSIGDAQVTLLA